MTIAIDGVDHAGKSSLGRFLSLQLGMPVIEADCTLKSDSREVTHDTELMGRLLAERHNMNRPVIIEGVFILRALAKLNIEPDFVIGVSAKGRRGSLNLQYAFRKYRSAYIRAKAPDYQFKWVPTE
ncbi:hypothetical protein [Acidovorax sp.]|uniref:hypothetical protein n=1 Tax=Acidovorax sp. TaxID=1872122 RepID=UPI0031D39EE7